MDHRILAVDPHPVTLRGYDALLRTEPDLTLVGTAKAGGEAVALARDVKPDLVISDLHLEEGGGFGLIKQFSTIGADGVLVVSCHEDAVFGSRALKAGARGYLQKESAAEEILEAIRTVLEGRVYLNDSLQEVVLKTYVGQGSGTVVESLTDRELEVFTEIGAGLPTGEIAQRLHISIKTVQTHRSNIMEKLGVDAKEKLVRQAVIWSLDKVS